MIARLSITNFLLIEELELEWHPGLNIVTGETGAGKSILMDALGLLTGERADPKSVRNPEKKCCIEAWFTGIPEELRLLFEASELEFESENILRREILPGGKSRAFVNDSPVTLDVLKTIAIRLFDIHGQQDSLLLGSSEMQFRLLDILAGSSTLQQSFRLQYQHWKKTQQLLEEKKKKNQESAAELDYKSYLLKELLEASIRKGEQEELEARLELQRNAGDIVSRLQQSSQMLEGGPDLLGNLKQISQLMTKVAPISPELGNLAQRLGSVYLELKDIAAEIRDSESSMELDPAQMQADEERLNRLYQLQKKHRVDSVEGLLQVQDELDGWLQQQDSSEEKLAALEKECREAADKTQGLALALHRARTEKLDSISAKVVQLLGEMAMPQARFAIQLEESAQPGPNGIAALRYLFSANPGMALSDLKNVASGGEFSRLMLAFKCLMAAGTEMPSLIFDEIDTGISGEVAMRVGKLIRRMAERHQVLVVTHSAQMASRAEAHWRVEKSQEDGITRTGVRQLSPEESTAEIASMISGSAPGKAALEAARELIRH